MGTTTLKIENNQCIREIATSHFISMTSIDAAQPTTQLTDGSPTIEAKKPCRKGWGRGLHCCGYVSLSRKHCSRKLFRRLWDLRKTGCFGFRRLGAAYPGFGNPYPSGGWTSPWGRHPFGFWRGYHPLAPFNGPFGSPWARYSVGRPCRRFLNRLHGFGAFPRPTPGPWSRSPVGLHGRHCWRRCHPFGGFPAITPRTWAECPLRSPCRRFWRHFYPFGGVSGAAYPLRSYYRGFNPWAIPFASPSWQFPAHCYGYGFTPYQPFSYTPSGQCCGFNWPSFSSPCRKSRRCSSKRTAHKKTD
jgi:hypothetical protein